MKKKLAIFDMDGTLFDTVPANQAAYAVALAPYGVSLSVEDFALHCNGRYYRDFLGELLGGDEAKIDAVHDAKLAAYPALFHRIRENIYIFTKFLIIHRCTGIQPPDNIRSIRSLGKCGENQRTVAAGKSQISGFSFGSF